MKRLIAGSAALVTAVGVGVGVLAAPTSQAQASAVTTTTSARTASVKYTQLKWEIKKPAAAGAYGKGTVFFDAKLSAKIPTRVDSVAAEIYKVNKRDVTHVQISAFSGKNKTGKKIGYDQFTIKSGDSAMGTTTRITSNKNVAKSVEIFFFTQHYNSSLKKYTYTSQSQVVNK